MSSISTLKPIKKRERKERSFFNRQAVKHIKKYVLSQITLKFICAFLLSRTSLIGGATPLGFAFFAANFGLSGTYSCAIALIMGLLFSKKSLLTIGKYIISIIIFALFQERFLPRQKHSSRMSAVCACLCILVSGYFLLYADATFGGYPLKYDSMV